MDHNSFTFFPGKGIYTTPDSNLEPVIEEYDRKTAQEIFSAFSLMAIGRETGNSYPEDIIRHAKILLDSHGMVLPRESKLPIGVKKSFSFDGTVESTGTRVSFKTKQIQWSIVERELFELGYSIRKREYLHGDLDPLVHVYVVANDETGVIAEGKGFTLEQARYSALAEAIERLYSQPQHPERMIIDSQDNLFRDKETKLEIISGTRDSYSENIVTEWIEAENLLTGENVFLPAEISYFKYIPRILKLKLFSLHHTTGLAAGSSAEEAALSAIFEIMERDAYWITMRCKINHPDIDIESIPNLDSKIKESLALLKKNGFEVHLKDMSLDWGIPIAHAVLVDSKNRIPTFSHGSGAAFDWPTAISRAVAEVIQMHSGMIDFANIPDNWERIVSAGDVLGRGELAWSDPLFRPHIGHLIEKSEQKFDKKILISTPAELLQSLKDKNYTVLAAKLNEIFGLSIVRVYISEATQPDERLERISARMHQFRIQNNLQAFYSDPILT